MNQTGEVSITLLFFNVPMKKVNVVILVGDVKIIKLELRYGIVGLGAAEG